MAPRHASDRVVYMVEGHLKGALTRGAPPARSVRQLAAETAHALDLGLRTIQRAMTDPRIAELVAQLVAHGGTTGEPSAANMHLDDLPPHPDDQRYTSLLLGHFSPGPESHWYKRLRPNEHSGYCVASNCRAWVDAQEGSILIPYPTDGRVPVLCSAHALTFEVDRILEGVTL